MQKQKWARKGGQTTRLSLAKNKQKTFSISHLEISLSTDGVFVVHFALSKRIFASGIALMSPTEAF